MDIGSRMNFQELKKFYYSNKCNVVVDSRQVSTGDIFFALPGEKVDGHNFLRQVAGKGASVAVVSEHYAADDYGMLLVYVENTVQVLQTLAQEVLKERSPVVVAVTGSLGKTTTRDFIFQLLQGFRRVAASPHNHNSKVGLPLAILNSDPEAEILILEMAIDDPDGLPFLMNIAPPDVGVLTGVDLVHAQFYSGLEDIAKAKSKIFNHPRTVYGVFNYDMPYRSKAENSGSCSKESFSVSASQADYYLSSDGDNITISHKDDFAVTMPWNIPGEHNKQNFLAAVAVAHYFGLTSKAMTKKVGMLKLPERRFQLFEKRGIVFVNDSYNACTSSMIAAMKSLPTPKKGGKTIAVLGEMVELGDLSTQEHLRVGEEALKYVDSVLCVGEECRHICDVWQREQRDVTLFDDRKVLAGRLASVAQEGDVVLIKGSNFNQLWKILEDFE